MEVEHGRHYVRVHPGYLIQEHETIISCPHALTFSLATWGNRDPSVSMSKVDTRSLTQTVALRLALMEEYLLGKDSSWWPYINILPQPVPESTTPEDAPKDNITAIPKKPFHTPLYFDEDDMLWLDGTNLGSAARQRAGAWKEEFEMAKDALKGLDESKKALWTRFAPPGHDPPHRQC